MKKIIFATLVCLLLSPGCKTPSGTVEEITKSYKIFSSSQTEPVPTPTPIPPVTREPVKQLERIETFTRVSDLIIDIDYPLGQWIPNTPDPANLEEYEKLPFSSITITAQLDNRHVLLEDAIGDIIFLPPEDFAFDPQALDGKKGNIYTNQGQGIIVYAKIGDHNVELVRFIRKKGSQAPLTATTLYKPSFNLTFFTEYGTTRDGFRLYSDRITGKLTFSGIHEGTPFTTLSFAAAALGDSVLPGDDFLLRFGLAQSPSITGTASKGDFLAVYDKKMLWRANLYVDDTLQPFTGEPTQQQDWNDRFPWSTEDNEWNRATPDYTGIPGGQVVKIYPWTRFIDGEDAADPDEENNERIYNSVAYSLGGIDTPFDFNIDLEDQIMALQAYYKEQNHQWQNWNLTIAPGDDWDNYLGGIPHEKKNTLGYHIIEDKPYFPYRPGYASFVEDFYWIDVNYSAGIDCNGLVDLATGYKGNRYFINEDDYYQVGKRERWSPYLLDNTKHFVQQFKMFSWHIWDDKPKRIIKDNEIIPPTMVVPGDLVIIHYYWVNPVTSRWRWDFDHIAIVGDLEYIDGERNLTRDSIILLEAAAGNDEFKVMNYRRFGGLRRFSGFNHWTFTICRLKQRN